MARDGERPGQVEVVGVGMDRTSLWGDDEKETKQKSSSKELLEKLLRSF